MENKQSPSKNKLISIKEEKLIREVNYDYLTAEPTKPFKKPLLLDLEIFKRNTASPLGSERVLVSIKARAPTIKTLYIAEKNRFRSKKGSSKSGSRLAIGDHSSFVTHLSEDDSNIGSTSIACGTEISKNNKENESIITFDEPKSLFISRCPHGQQPPPNLYNDKPKPPEKCYLYTLPQLNIPRIEGKANQSKYHNKVDIETLIVTNTPSEYSVAPICKTVDNLQRRISHLERKILRQEMVFRSIDPDLDFSSSDEEAKENDMKSSSGTGRPGCSYVQQYSHVPETSAFQRYAHQAAPLSPSKATTIEKEHNSEQYGRDFTAYDGITARGRRQCASVPCKRDDVPKIAAERVHKIRHKLNPVRDYRLMDTVHYLAQGEFAPRDDGIKLTPSREAVLSDIIWEDVCRTHWPNTRLGRRLAHTDRERCSTRCELQKLIDSLLRERVAHVERRRRRHYRIVKLNHRHENCKPLGKTGDIIVASHKNRPGSEETPSDVNATRLPCSARQSERSQRRSHRSHNQLPLSEARPKKPIQDECSPGPSYVSRREPTCCYQASTKAESSVCDTQSRNQCCAMSVNEDITSITSASTSKSQSRTPRLIVKKENSRRKHTREDPDLEHYIVLPTLVIRTPSNVKRQKKFNELYHRILNTQMFEDQSKNYVEDNEVSALGPAKKDVGLNINVNVSNSIEAFSKGAK